MRDISILYTIYIDIYTIYIYIYKEPMANMSSMPL